MAQGWGRGYAQQTVKVYITLAEDLDLTGVDKQKLDEKIVGMIVKHLDDDCGDRFELGDGGIVDDNQDVYKRGDYFYFSIDLEPWVSVSMHGDYSGYREVNLVDGGVTKIDKSKLYDDLNTIPELTGKLDEKITVHIGEVKNYENIEDCSDDDRAEYEYQQWRESNY